jgi:hypothetical protein
MNNLKQLVLSAKLGFSIYIPAAQTVEAKDKDGQIMRRENI